MDIKELLDEDAFDPEKLFNEKEYSTLLINRAGFSKKENAGADLIEALLEKDLTRAESEELFEKLKTTNSGKLLVDAIKKAGRVSEKIKLVAACWECGLDFSPDFLVFVELSCHDDFQLALEALSVVESSEGVISEGTLETAMEIAEVAKNNKNPQLVSDLISNLKSRMNV
ncbi:MAG: hypothetical protein PSX36_00750 [bacterium]|nr:hypothetical protein [bacterium]